MVFCVALGIAGLGAAYTVGWDFASFALDSSRRKAPVQVLRLERIASSIDFSGYEREWLQPMGDLVESHSGIPVSMVTTRHLVRGQIRERWDVLAVEQFSSGQNLIDLLTSPPYRELRQSIEYRQRSSALYILEDHIDFTWRGKEVLFFLAFGDSGPTSSIGLLESVLRKFKGQELWRSGLTVLRDQDTPDWQLVISFGFPDDEYMLEWINDTEQLTNTTIANTLVKRLAIVVTDLIDSDEILVLD